MRLLTALLTATLLAGCVHYETHIPDVLDMRAELSGRHEPVQHIETEQTRFWALYFFTAKQMDAGEYLEGQLDAAPTYGLRSITWESELGPLDFLRWLAINGTAQAISTVLAFKRVPDTIPNPSEIANKRIESVAEGQSFAIPANIFIQSRTLRIRAEVVSIDREPARLEEFEQYFEEEQAKEKTEEKTP